MSKNNNSKCISKMFEQMKEKNKCPCYHLDAPAGAWCDHNEVVYNTNTNGLTILEFYNNIKNNHNIKPAGFILYIPNFYYLKEIKLNWPKFNDVYDDTLRTLKNIFFLDTKVIILFENDHGITRPPFFKGITTLENFEEYLKNIDITEYNNCNINRSCPD